MSRRFVCAIGFARYVLAALVVVTVCHPAAAQSQPERYSLIVRGAPLDDALEALVARTRIDLAYDPPLVRGKQANCAAENVSAEDLLRCVLKGTDLDFYRLSSGLYVLTPKAETVPLYGGLRGIVVDAETRQPLPNAHVMLANQANGTAANDAGMFAFPRLKPGRYVVLATYVGYEAAATTVDVPPGGDAQAELALEAEPLVVQPIVIDGLQWRLPSADLGTESLAQNDLLRNPSAGASDVLVGLNSLLGVRVSDATADIHVQGGETGEHQLRLDGAPVFLPLNFASFVGPFSPFAIGRLTVHKAGFSASEGSQISGVIDIRHDLNVAERTRVDVQADPLSANARVSLVRGRYGETQGTVTAAGRIGLWSLYSPQALQDLLEEWNTTDPFLFTLFDRTGADNPKFELREDKTAGNPGIGFRDLHLASRVRFGLLKSLHTSFYVGQSRLGSDLADPEEAAPETTNLFADAEATEPFRDLFIWDTGVGQTHFETVLSGRAMARVGLRGSFYRVRHDYSVPDTTRGTGLGPNGEELSAVDDGNRVYEVAAEGRLDYVLNRWNSITTGLELIRTGTRFAILGTQSDPIQHNSASWRAAGFLEDEISVGDRFSIDLGTRVTYLPTHHRVYAEPRIALRYDQPAGVLGRWSARVSTGRYRQFINQFDVSSRSPRALLSSTRFWLATVDPELEPPSASHFSGELLWNPTRNWTIRLEGYFKNQDNILALDYDTVPGEENMRQRDFLVESDGTVRGAGAQVQRSLGPGRVELRYEYNEARRKIEGSFECRNQDDCDPIYVPWNEPHRLEFGLDLVPWDRLTFLTRWKGVWGRTWGFRQGYYDFVGAFASIAPDLPPDLITRAEAQINRFRLDHPDEHELEPIYQLDVSAAYTQPLSDGSTLQLRVDVLNVLDRENVSEWHLFFDPETFYEGEDAGFLQKEERPLLPRLVSVAVKWTLH